MLKNNIKRKNGSIVDKYPTPRYYFPKRFNLIVLGFLALTVCYTTRTLLSTCVIFMNKEFHYGSTFKGVLLAAFSMGYSTTQLTAQFLCDKFGSKRIILFGLTMSICTLFIVPIAAPYKAAIVLVRVFCGIFQGIVMPSLNLLIANYFPITQRSTCAGMIWAGVYAGNVGISFISPVLLEYLNWRDCFYIVGSVCIIMWGIPWAIFIRDNPKDLIGIHENEIRFINQIAPVEVKLKTLTQSQVVNIKTIMETGNTIKPMEENEKQQQQIQNNTSDFKMLHSSSNSTSTVESSTESLNSMISDEGGEQTTSSELTIEEPKQIKEDTEKEDERLPYSVAFKKLITSRGMLTIVYLNISCNWAYFLLLGWLPTWLSKELGINVGYKFAFFNALPFILCLAISVGFGRLSDKLLSMGVRKIILRKTFGGLCYGIPGVFLLMVSLVIPNHSTVTKIAFVTISIAANGFSNTSYQLVTLDLSSKYSGVSMGIANICSAIPAFIGPLVGGFLLESFHGDWNKIFLISSSFYLFGTIIWLIFLKVDNVI
ncbi:hypothetical protein ACTA71_009463 [Dictyostelium dimigraforme]